MEAGGNEDAEVVRNCDGAAVEGLMVDAAAGETVVGGVRAAELTPADVRGLQRQISVVQLHGVAAEGAAVAPGGDHRTAEIGIPTGAANGGV